MKIGDCCTVEQAPLAKQVGFDYIEVGVQKFLIPLESDAAFAPNLTAANACPLPIPAANGFLPGDLKSTGPDCDPAGIERYAAVAFRRARQIGIHHIVFGSGGSRQVPDGFPAEKANEQFVHVLQRLGPLAAAYDITVVIEPLRTAECNFINTVAQGADLVRMADHPNIQLLADFYHMLCNGEEPGDCKRFGKLIQHAHVAEKAKRTCPGIDGDDFVPFLKGLIHTGYQGLLSMECKFPNGLEADGPKALKTLRDQLAAAKT